MLELPGFGWQSAPITLTPVSSTEQAPTLSHQGRGIRWSAFKATGFRVFVDPIFLIVIYYTSFQGDP